MKAREGGLRSEVHSLGLFLSRSSEDTCRMAAREPATLPAVTGRQSMEGPAPSTRRSSSPQRATTLGQSMQTAAAFGDKPGKPLWPHGYLSTRHRRGQTGHTGRILTGDVELDSSAGHQLCPEQKMNSKFLFSHGFHPDPLCTWSQYTFFLLNT